MTAPSSFSVNNFSSSALLDTTMQFRQQLLDMEQGAADEMTSFYANTYASVTDQLNALADQIAAAQASGEDVSPSWLHSQDRLSNLLDGIQAEINHFAQAAQGNLAESQRKAAQLGDETAQAQLNATLPPSMSYSFGSVPPSVLESFVGAAQPGSPLADLFASFGPDAAETIQQGLFTGLATGTNPRVVAANLAQDVTDLSLNRARTIARTEMLRSYRSAALANYQANSDVVGGWTWVAALSTNTCAICWAMNGTTHGLDEFLDSHANCRCAMAPLTKSWADLGIQGLDQLDEEGNVAEESLPDIPSPTGMQERLTLNRQEQADYKFLRQNEARYQQEVADYAAQREEAARRAKAGDESAIADEKFASLMEEAAQSQLDVLAELRRRAEALKEVRRQVREAKAARAERLPGRIERAIPYEPPLFPSGEERFADLAPADQLKILGKSKFALYVDGKLKLADLVGAGHDDAWGGYRYEKPLKDLGLSQETIQQAQKAADEALAKGKETPETTPTPEPSAPVEAAPVGQPPFDPTFNTTPPEGLGNADELRQQTEDAQRYIGNPTSDWSPTLRQQGVERIVTALNDNPDVQALIDRLQSKQIGKDPTDAIGNALYAFHKAFFSRSSTGGVYGDPLYAALQEAARAEFGLDDASQLATPDQLAAMQSAYGDVLPGFRAVLRQVYEDTQAYYRSQGITELSVFRGMTYEPGKAPAGLDWNGDVTTLATEGMPLASWSVSLEQAANYAYEPYLMATGYDGLLLGARIPVERIFGFEATGIGYNQQREVVVLGGQMEAFGLAKTGDQVEVPYGYIAAPRWFAQFYDVFGGLTTQEQQSLIAQNQQDETIQEQQRGK